MGKSHDYAVCQNLTKAAYSFLGGGRACILTAQQHVWLKMVLAVKDDGSNTPLRRVTASLCMKTPIIQ